MPAKGTAKKLKDKWRLKNWYRILAPEIFNFAVIGETLADEPEKLIGRVEEVTVQELTGDFTRSHIKLKFKITKVVNTNAHTCFTGHEFTTDYVRRLTRRKRSKVDCIVDVLTKDSIQMRVKAIAVADKRIQTSQKNKIRIIIADVIKETGRTSVFSELVRDMLSGEISKRIGIAVKPIYLLKKIEIRKSEVFPFFEPVEEKKVEPAAVVSEPTQEISQPEQAAQQLNTTDKPAN